MNLVDAMSSDFAAAKKWAMLSLLVGSAVYFASVIAIFLPPGADKTLAAVGFLAQVFTIFARMRTDEFYNCGETVRRAAMLQDGYGIQPSMLVMADLCARVCLPASAKPTYLGSYYASQITIGPRRIAEILLESAFWTKNLAAKAASIMWSAVALGTIIIFFIGISFLLWGSHVTRMEEIARALLVSLGFWTVGDWTVLAIKYQILARSTEPVLRNTEKLLGPSNTSSDEALIQLGEYNAALACGPVIPQFVYRIYQSRLNHAWNAAYPKLK
jgi:hypothetical protein